jgi:uracil-DNA glycosylase
VTSKDEHVDDHPGRDEGIDVRTEAELAGLPSTWNEILRDRWDEQFWRTLLGYVEDQRAEHAVYPPADRVFRAFELSDFDDTRVVILGQDPYHGPGQADGLCFSVPDGVPRRPPSLVNILKELKTDEGVELTSGNLEGWARQGVLLLNTTLTVRGGKAGSHRRQGWERFTDGVLEALNAKDHRVVFILWGSDARKKKRLITNPAHVVIESAHPSPLAAYKGFFGSKPFSRTNTFLREASLPPIDWSETGAVTAAGREA